jgi:hypothetical protein
MGCEQHTKPYFFINSRAIDTRCVDPTMRGVDKTVCNLAFLYLFCYAARNS